MKRLAMLVVVMFVLAVSAFAKETEVREVSLSVYGQAQEISRSTWRVASSQILFRPSETEIGYAVIMKLQNDQSREVELLITQQHPNFTDFYNLDTGDSVHFKLSEENLDPNNRFMSPSNYLVPLP